MKTEEILLRKAEGRNRIELLSGHWPWLVPGREADYEIVTLFEGEDFGGWNCYTGGGE